MIPQYYLWVCSLENTWNILVRIALSSALRLPGIHLSIIPSCWIVLHHMESMSTWLYQHTLRYVMSVTIFGVLDKWLANRDVYMQFVSSLALCVPELQWLDPSVPFSTLQLENNAQPAIITKDLCMVVYGRDSRTIPRSLRHLFSGSYKNAEANRICGVYETVLKRAAEAGSPGLWFSPDRCREVVMGCPSCPEPSYFG